MIISYPVKQTPYKEIHLSLYTSTKGIVYPQAPQSCSPQPDPRPTPPGPAIPAPTATTRFAFKSCFRLPMSNVLPYRPLVPRATAPPGPPFAIHYFLSRSEYVQYNMGGGEEAPAATRLALWVAMHESATPRTPVPLLLCFRYLLTDSICLLGSACSACSACSAPLRLFR